METEFFFPLITSVKIAIAESTDEGIQVKCRD